MEVWLRYDEFLKFHFYIEMEQHGNVVNDMESMVYHHGHNLAMFIYLESETFLRYDGYMLLEAYPKLAKLELVKHLNS